MAKNTITISFKPNNQQEQELKEWVENQIGGHSAFIKNLLLKAKKEEEEKNNFIPKSHNEDNYYMPKNLEDKPNDQLIDLSDF